MADDLVNALTTANRSASVLQGIANPTVVNPLQIIGAANQAAQSEFQTRGLQAQQALGNILQQSTDANGNLDYQKAHTLAAQAGPVVQMGMQKFALDNASLRGSQIEQTGAKQKLIGMHSMDLLRDPSDQNVNLIADSMKARGMPEAEAEKFRLTVLGMKDPNQRKAFAYQAGLNSLDAMHQVIGKTTLENTGGGYRPVTTYQPDPFGRSGAATPGPGGVPTTLTPGQATEIVSVNVPDGPPIQMPRELADRALRSNPRLQELNPGWSYLNPGTGGGGGQPGGPPPGSGGQLPPGMYRDPQRGNQILPNFDPVTGQPLSYSTTPPPMPPGARPDGPGRRSSLEGGVPVASADQSMVPQTGAPGAPMPMVASDVADIQAGMAQARANPRPAGTQIASNAGPPPSASQQFQPTAARADAAGSPARTGPTRWGEQPPPGFGEQQTTGAKAASGLEAEAQTARSATQPLLTAMLPELEAIKNTGVGQKTLSFMQQMAIRSGMVPPKFDPTNPQASMEALGKVFARYQAAQLSALGAQPSDSRQTLAEATSPSMSYSSAGNRKIIHSLMGTNDALDTMYSAWMNSQTRTSNPGNFTAWREAFTAPVQSGPLAGARFDPTVFAVNRMPASEQKQYLTDLRKASPNDYQQFTKNWALGIHEGWVRPLNAAPTPGGGG